MPIRFEVGINGKRVCMAGIDNDGVLSAGVSFVKLADREARFDFHVGGLGRFARSEENDRHVGWRTPAIGAGDEITIRILPPGKFDPPSGHSPGPPKRRADKQFGKIIHAIDAWDGEIAFPCPPFETAHIHLRSSAKGPTAQQRRAIRELMRRHATIWPSIAEALLRCHDSIKSVRTLEKRLERRIGIDLDRDAKAVSISYELAGDRRQRSLHVKLRDWELTEICMAD